MGTELDQVHLVLIETSANQAFVFETNKRRENVGASQLIHDLGGRWVPEAVDRLPCGEGLIEDGRAEEIVAASGKALVLVPGGAMARRLSTDVTAAALRAAPGLDVCSVVSAPFAWGDPGSLAAASTEVHRLFQDVRARRPGPALRSLRLPIVSECATSGLPASGTGREAPGEEVVDLSAPSLARWQAFEAGLARLAAQSQTASGPLRSVVKYLADGAEWVGVVHADGNGVGQVFRDFDQWLPDGPGGRNRVYADSLRSFSAALDRCARDAYRAARLDLPVSNRASDHGIEVPTVLPLVLGGDDLTVVCEGSIALEFTRRFLLEFEDHTAADEVVGPLLQRATGARRLGACAGVALVKPHYPFASAYDLAEELTASAKTVKKRMTTACSALDFHVLYDSAGAELGQIRDQLTSEQRRPEQRTWTIFARPYVVTAPSLLDDEPGPAREWAERHHWDRLEDRVAALRATDDVDGQRRRRLPSSQVHHLRSALVASPQAGQDCYRQLLHHYAERGLKDLGYGDEVGWQDEQEGVDPGPVWRTAVLDAIDAAGFLAAPAASGPRP